MPVSKHVRRQKNNPFHRPPPKMHEACTSLLACLSASACCHRYLVCTRRHRLRGQYFGVILQPPLPELTWTPRRRRTCVAFPLDREKLCASLHAIFFVLEARWTAGEVGDVLRQVVGCQALSVRGYLGMCLDIFRCQRQFKVEEPAGTRM